MKALAHRLLSSEDGQDLIEYALLSTFVALACTVGVTALGNAFGNVFAVVTNQLALSGP
jgi:Flp pilus assembly pilin Flp